MEINKYFIRVFLVALFVVALIGFIKIDFVTGLSSSICFFTLLIYYIKKNKGDDNND